MASSMPDSSPNRDAIKGSKTGDHPNGIRNDDSRMGGHKWNDSDPVKSRKDWGIEFSDNAVGVEPNVKVDGLLVTKGTKGLGKVVESSTHE